VLFCHITTHVKERKHEDLLEKKGGQGFPHIVFMDSEGAVIAEHDGDRDAAGFGATGKKAVAFTALREKAATGDPAAKVEFLLVQLELGQLGDDEAGARLKDLGKLSPEQEKKVAELRSGAAVRAIMAKVTDEKSQMAAGEKFYEMKKAGRVAPTAEREAQPYWICMMYYAEEKKDAATYEDALKSLKARFGQVEEAKDFFKKAEETLQELKAGKK
jgi:hypothetical protein